MSIENVCKTPQNPSGHRVMVSIGVQAARRVKVCHARQRVENDGQTYRMILSFRPAKEAGPDLQTGNNDPVRIELSRFDPFGQGLGPSRQRSTETAITTSGDTSLFAR